MPFQALTPLQTQVLGLLTTSEAARNWPYLIIKACHDMLFYRRGCSDVDTIYHLRLMMEQQLLTPSELPRELLAQVLAADE